MNKQEFLKGQIVLFNGDCFDVMQNLKDKENDLIFDGFLGSGTTAISCIKTKRRLIGCELDNEYFDKICKRIEEELRQGNLF